MSSYFNSDFDYLNIFKIISIIKKPKLIVEFGLLNGDSLQTLAESNLKSKVYSYDIFDEFKGNRANKTKIIKKFKKFNNVKIQYGNYFNKNLNFKDNKIDLLHIDIANDADVYEFFIQNYFRKLSKKGIAILEGGSKKRDKVGWMKKYKKKKINNYLNNLNERKYKFFTIGELPSITIFYK